MKGYIVGYFESWGNDRNPIIVGYYTTWSRALDVTKQLERNNLDYHQGFQNVYLVEVEVNKTYPTNDTPVDWIDNYTNYRATTVRGNTALRSNKGRVFEIELPESELKPEPMPEPVRVPEPVPEPVRVPEPAPEGEWTEVERKKPRSYQKPRQQKSRRGKRLSRPSRSPRNVPYFAAS